MVACSPVMCCHRTAVHLMRSAGSSCSTISELQGCCRGHYPKEFHLYHGVCRRLLIGALAPAAAGNDVSITSGDDSLLCALRASVISRPCPPHLADLSIRPSPAAGLL